MDDQGLKSLVTELGLDNLPEDKKNDLLVSMTDALQTRISSRVMIMLTEKQKNELEEIMKTGSEQKANDYLVQNIPNFADIIADEYEIFRKESLELNEETKKILQDKK